mmetsp:Transcript_2099/g.2857  ORF Transcript_2099/g.2857 Transcript_2099/m.2857 type:complete len:225 (-) Transcript_2099:229-903(-)
MLPFSCCITTLSMATWMAPIRSSAEQRRSSTSPLRTRPRHSSGSESSRSSKSWELAGASPSRRGAPSFSALAAYSCSTRWRMPTIPSILSSSAFFIHVDTVERKLSSSSSANRSSTIFMAVFRSADSGTRNWPSGSAADTTIASTTLPAWSICPSATFSSSCRISVASVASRPRASRSASLDALSALSAMAMKKDGLATFLISFAIMPGSSSGLAALMASIMYS